MRKQCILYDRECIECGECNMCDLDPSKVCDNCGKCIGMEKGLDYRAIMVDGVITADMNPEDYLYDEDDEPPSIEDDDDLTWP